MFNQTGDGWRSLYRVGGISGIVAVLVYATALVLVSVAPPPTNADGSHTLDYVAAHRGLYTVEQVLWLAPGALVMVMFLALAVSLRTVDKSYAAIAGLVGVSSWALTLALPTSGGGAPLLVDLSLRYATATESGQRTAYATIAEGLLADNRTPNLVGVLTTVGILLISVVMVKSAYPRWVAVLGIMTGGLGIVSETLRPVLGGWYAVYGVLLLIWLAVVGWRLTQHTRE
jgi:hypothetical protein